MNISAIEPQDVEFVRPMISDGLDAMLETHSLGRHTADDVWNKTGSGEWLLFIISDDDNTVIASVICSILEGHKNTLEVGMCWGSQADAWAPQIAMALDHIGRDLGCDQIALNGRPGWQKLGKALGFKLNSVVLVRHING